MRLCEPESPRNAAYLQNTAEADGPIALCTERLNYRYAGGIADFAPKGCETWRSPPRTELNIAPLLQEGVNPYSGAKLKRPQGAPAFFHRQPRRHFGEMLAFT
jgi:hypothetical protein